MEMNSRVAIVISDKIDFKTESIIKDKAGTLSWPKSS